MSRLGLDLKGVGVACRDEERKDPMTLLSDISGYERSAGGRGEVPILLNLVRRSCWQDKMLLRD
ncbi:hypothetical protein FQA47_012032 [Oryzias melastigma]|uniref:Uncharacterized protein n=1 Tax=Oryzias melastigma TaxID=30732 RepID=A0A834F9I1_ORYME|nr:hypothetical protein FQA47_012032 [Oryzias melastigma]